MLSARRPESGGVYSFAKESFGPRAANAVAWLFILWDTAGAPAVMIIAASYLAYALPLSRTLVYLVAGLLLIGTFGVNYRGILVSSRVQMILISAIPFAFLGAFYKRNRTGSMQMNTHA